MHGDQLDDALECPQSHRGVIRHRNMKFSPLLRGEANVGALLTHTLIAENLKSLDQIGTRDVARGPHAARTSSLTK